MLAPASAWADKVKVAVMDLQGMGINAQETAVLSDSLREALLKTQQFQIIDRSQLKAILDEQALQQAVCSGEACTAKLGALVGAKRIVAGKCVKLDDALFLVSAMMVDVDTSETLKLESVQHRGDLLGLMQAPLPNLARRLAGLSDDGATAAAAPPQPKRDKNVPLRIAIFPSYLTGQNAHRLSGVHDRLIKEIEKIAKDDGKLQLTASFYETKNDPEAYKRFRALPEFVDVEKDAWEGLFITTPNERLIYKVGRKLGADVIYLQYSDHNGENRGGKRYHAYLYDVETLQVLHASGEWPPFGWSRTLSGVLKTLVDKYRALH